MDNQGRKRMVFDIETLGLDPYAGRIVAIGIIDVEKEEVETWLGEDEEKILRRFLDRIQGDEILIGFNIRNFDLPYLKARLIVNNIPSNKLKFPPMEIIDLSELLHYGIYKEFGSNRRPDHFYRMDDFCRLMDIEGSFDLTGMMVTKWFAEKKWDLIEKHLIDDLNKTYELYKILKNHFSI